MAEYYYHPLGDYAQKYLEDAPTVAFPHTYNNHGWGKLDFGVGGGLPVYSMTDGVISSINCDIASGEEGFVVVIRTDRVDGEGKPIYINYLEMDGLSDTLAAIIGGKGGNKGYDKISRRIPLLEQNIQIRQKDQIGYTNDRYDGSSLHMDFTYGDRFCPGQKNGESHEGFDSSSKVPHLKSVDQLDSSFSTDGKTVYCNNQLVGNADGMVPTRTGESSSVYTVYPVISYLTLLQRPSKFESVAPAGAVSIVGSQSVLYSENMNQEALSFYLTGTMDDSWIGDYPDTLDNLNNSEKCRAARMATAICMQELNFETFSCVTYAKLIRAKMIGESWQKGDTAKAWFENLNPKQFDLKDKWSTRTFSTEVDLQKAQLVYNNLKYPDIYGAEKFDGTKEFYEQIIYACQQVPIYNLSPKQYKPWAFCVDFDVKKNINYGTSSQSSGAGHYLLYRQQSGDMSSFNSKVKGGSN